MPAAFFGGDNDSLGGLKEMLYEKLPSAETGTEWVLREGQVPLPSQDWEQLVQVQSHKTQFMFVSYVNKHVSFLNNHGFSAVKWRSWIQ